MNDEEFRTFAIQQQLAKHQLPDEPVTRARVFDVLRLVRPHRWTVTAALLLLLLGTGLALLQPWLAGRAVDGALSGGGVTALVLVLIALFLVQAAIETFGGFLLERTGEGVVFDLRTRLVRRLLWLRVPVLSEHRVGDLISRATVDTTVLRTVTARSLVQLVTGTVALIGTVVLMIVVDALLFVIVLGTFAIAGLVVMVVLSKIEAAAEQAQRSVGLMAADLERALSATRTVKANRAEEREYEHITGVARSAYEAGVRTAKLTALVNPAVHLAVTGSFVMTLLVGGVRVAAGETSLSALVMILLYAMNVVIPVGDLFEAAAELRKAMGSMQRVHATLNLPIEDPEERGTPAAGVTPVPRNGAPAPALEFRDVHFRYGERPILSGISFTVGQRGHVALVGRSGAGKSTIFSLINRFYQPEHGQILMGGQDAGELSLAESRSRIGLLEQHAPMMFGSLRDNLTYGAVDFDDDELRRIIGLAGLTDVVARLPAGLETPVGEHGDLLSGGERQRIALARALLRKPKLLMLDEPTAMLDTATENALNTAIQSINEQCAVLVIAHRLSTIRSAKTVVLLHDGHVAATGTHDELMETSDRYRWLIGETQQDTTEEVR